MKNKTYFVYILSKRVWEHKSKVFEGFSSNTT